MVAMEYTGEINPFATKQTPEDVNESANNMLDSFGSLDSSASSLVQETDAEKQQMKTASGLSGDGNQIEMDTNQSIEAPPKEKQLELMDVNDDCLRAIFKRLPILDLASVADVCNRFRSIAQENFWLTKPLVNIPLDVCRREYIYAQYIRNDEKSEIVQRAARLFRNFGSLMTKLEVEPVEPVDSVIQFTEKIVALINKYCSRNLIALMLNILRAQSLPIGLKPIFSNLKKMGIGNCIEFDASAWEWLTDVEHLKVFHISPDLYAGPLEPSYRNLQRIEFKYCKIDSRDFEKFLDKNPTLKDIHIDWLRCEDNHTFKLPAQIEKLHLRTDLSPLRVIEMSSFGTLKNLKSLGLSDDPLSCNSIAAIIREVVAADIPLKHLTLESLTMEMSNEFRKFCDEMQKLVHLDTLKLKDIPCNKVDVLEHFAPKLNRLTELSLEADFSQESILTVDELASIVSSFHNLQRLKVYSYRGEEVDPSLFDSKSFERLVTIVRNRKNNTRLEIDLADKCYKLEIPKDLIQLHSDILILSARRRTRWFE